MYYRICYNKDTREKLKLPSSFGTLCDVDLILSNGYDPEADYFDDFEEFTKINTRTAAVDYIDDHRQYYEQLADGGYTGNIFGWCIECTDGGKPTALLYEDEKWGFIWLNIINGTKTAR